MPRLPSFEQAPRFYARLAGLAYLAVIALGIFGEAFVRGALVVAGDGLTTAAHIAQSPGLWRLGIAGDLLMHLLDVPLIVFFYYLLRPVSNGLALLSSAFNLVQTAVLTANKITLIAPLLLVLDSTPGTTLPSDVLGPLVAFAARLHGYGFGVGLLFFGLACLIRGQLLRRSGYCPPLLGMLIIAGGACYLLNSAALLMAPALASAMFPWMLAPSFVGELALALWLVAGGPNIAAWQREIHAAGSRA